MIEQELPEGWLGVTLEDIALWGSGGTPNRSESSYYGGNIPWVKTGDLNDDILTEASEYITEAGVRNSSAKLFSKGSVVIAMYGATIGKLAILGIDATTNQACGVAQVHKGISNKFLYYYLKSQKEAFIEKGKGGAQPNISQTVIKLHPFPLPPLAEQTRIVAKLDTAFAHLETLKTSLSRIPELLKKFRQTVLTQAVTGKLTEEWREMQLKLTKQNTLLKKNSLFKENEPGIYEGWTRSSVAEIAEMISGYAFKSDEFTSSGIQVVRMGNLYQDKLNLDRNPVYLPENFDPKLTKKYSAKPGDILLSLTGTKYKRDYGYAILVPELEAPILINQRILCLRPVVNKHFLLYMLRDNLFRDQFFAFETGAVNQGNVGSTAVENIELDIPSVEEQQEIVNRVEALFAKVDALDAQYQSLKAKIDQLPQALLAKAFRGELVPQNPTDEPASVLLERIKMAATNSPAKGIREGRTKTADVIGTKQTRKRMKGKPVKTLPEFVDRLTQLGGKAEPKQLLIEFDLQEDVDSFFELLRDGKAQGLLSVPTGTGGPIELA